MRSKVVPMDSVDLHQSASDTSFEDEYLLSDAFFPFYYSFIVIRLF